MKERRGTTHNVVIVVELLGAGDAARDEWLGEVGQQHPLHPPVPLAAHAVPKVVGVAVARQRLLGRRLLWRCNSNNNDNRGNLYSAFCHSKRFTT